jgi:hypothetical protein
VGPDGRIEEDSMRRFGILASGVLTLVMVGAPAAFAATPPSTETTVLRNVTESFADINPCTDPVTTGTVTITYNSVFHITDFNNGVYVVKGSLEGSFVFVPDDPSGVTYTGHVVNRFGENSTPPGAQFGATDTFIVHATGSDGSRLTVMILNHITRTPAGAVVSEFHVVSCR